VHLLEAARHVKSVKAVLCVTTDKVYHNREWLWAYRENDRLGGKDPYSASKAAAEFAIQSFAASFAANDGSGPAIATARGGNIVGGGDWSDDRLIPDFVRAMKNNAPLTLRFPEATRPWQHVLALVQGYLMLLAGLISDDPARFQQLFSRLESIPGVVAAGGISRYFQINAMHTAISIDGQPPLDATTTPMINFDVIGGR